MRAAEEYQMRQVETLTPGVFLLLDDPSADRLERLLGYADNGSTEDIHKFCLCFERASMGLFFLPSELWVREFEKRIGGYLKRCDIRLTKGVGGITQWDRDNPPPKPVKGKRRG